MSDQSENNTAAAAVGDNPDTPPAVAPKPDEPTVIPRQLPEQMLREDAVSTVGTIAPGAPGYVEARAKQLADFIEDQKEQDKPKRNGEVVDLVEEAQVQLDGLLDSERAKEAMSHAD